MNTICNRSIEEGKRRKVKRGVFSELEGGERSAWERKKSQREGALMGKKEKEERSQRGDRGARAKDQKKKK